MLVLKQPGLGLSRTRGTYPAGHSGPYCIGKCLLKSEISQENIFSTYRCIKSIFKILKARDHAALPVALIKKLRPPPAFKLPIPEIDIVSRVGRGNKNSNSHNSHAHLKSLCLQWHRGFPNHQISLSCPFTHHRVLLYSPMFSSFLWLDLNLRFLPCVPPRNHLDFLSTTY